MVVNLVQAVPSKEKIAMITIAQIQLQQQLLLPLSQKLIASGQVGQNLVSVPNHVVVVHNTFKGQYQCNLKMVVNLVLEIPSSKKNAMILIAQLTVAGITGVIGHLVQKHVVKDPKIEEEKCKLVPKMGVHYVKVYRCRLKVAMLEIVQVQLIANGQVGQKLDRVANHVVEAYNILKEQ